MATQNDGRAQRFLIWLNDEEREQLRELAFLQRNASQSEALREALRAAHAAAKAKQGAGRSRSSQAGGRALPAAKPAR